MNKKVKKQQYQRKIMMLLIGIFFCCNSSAELFSNSKKENSSVRELSSTRDEDNFYVASNNSVQQLFYVLGGVINKPIIVSAEAAKKRVSGNFDLSKPKELLTTLASRTGLIWYDDGSSIYVYDSGEMKNSIVRLTYAPFDRLVAFLQSSGLHDSRFPLRSDNRAGTFYVSGPPVYIELISAAAKYIDASYASPGSGETIIRVIKLKNTFVNDRSYTQRDIPITIVGVATVLNQLLNHSSSVSGKNNNPIGRARISIDDDTKMSLNALSVSQNGSYPQLPAFSSYSNKSQGNDSSESIHHTINIVAYSDTNSLLVQGSARQVGFVEDLVNAIDIPKQQIQLSLWIIDISKDDVNELGIRWQGAAKISNTGISFNTSSLTPESSLDFLADITALAKKGNAQVVSRPEILTQENIPALFDNNSSFYAKLIGERNSSLEKITYGTMISVLPRFAQRQQEIEMILNIQDGGLLSSSDGKAEYVDNLPSVQNTQISTEARVPVGYSLLVGGYSRDQEQYHNIGIPLLKDIPFLGKLFDYSYTSNKKMIRLFLIQPRLLSSGDAWQGYEMNDPVLGRTRGGDDVTLKSTVSMLRNTMK